tara:strand:- start:577 stop:1224 length:648 start_codon:yes stop_codon:yes gene_type:complete
MAQQTQFKKLKEQIEAAKRGLTEMSDSEIDVVTAQAFSSSASPEIVEPKQIKIKPDDVLSSGSTNTRVVDMVPKTDLCDTPIADHTLGASTEALTNEFQFFHREKQPKSSGDLALSASLKEANNVASEALSFERLGRRLAILEGDVEQNRKYILELIDLLSKLDLRQKPVNRKLKPSQRLNRRHLFWLVIGFLAIGWFGLTPSGHVAIRHFLTFM